MAATLWTIAAVRLVRRVVWLAHVAGNVIHLLFLVALVIAVYNLFFGNRATQAR